MATLWAMLHSMTDEGRTLEDALDGLAQVFCRPAAAQRLGEHATCAEADRIAWALIVSRHRDAAAVWLNGHAASDSEEDLHGGAGFDAHRYLAGRG